MTYTTVRRVYSVSGLSSNEISEADVQDSIYEAQAQLNARLKKNFETAQKSLVLDGNNKNYIILQEYPLVSVDSLSIDGVSITTSELYVYKEAGKVQLKPTAEDTYFRYTEPQGVNITYTYGYDYDFECPDIANNPDAFFIRKLTSQIAAISILVQQIGGTFDDITSYSLPEFTASKGEPYTNIRETISRLDKSLHSMFNSKTYNAIAQSVFMC